MSPQEEEHHASMPSFRTSFEEQCHWCKMAAQLCMPCACSAFTMLDQALVLLQISCRGQQGGTRTGSLPTRDGAPVIYALCSYILEG